MQINKKPNKEIKMTFAPDNYCTTDIEFDYDILNNILSGLLNGSTDENDIKNYSDKINDSLVEMDGKIYYDDIIVGVTIINE